MSIYTIEATAKSILSEKKLLRHEILEVFYQFILSLATDIWKFLYQYVFV